MGRLFFEQDESGVWANSGELGQRILAVCGEVQYTCGYGLATEKTRNSTDLFRLFFSRRGCSSPGDYAAVRYAAFHHPAVRYATVHHPAVR